MELQYRRGPASRCSARQKPQNTIRRDIAPRHRHLGDIRCLLAVNINMACF
jgi:hypothetical protein